MPAYKYRFFYKSQEYLGNSVDAIARAISRETKMSFTEAVVLVNKSIIPTVVGKPKEFNPESRHKITLSEAWTGAKSILKQELGGDTVSQEQIMKRSAVCSGCPKRSEISGCTSCGFASKLKRWSNSLKKLFGGGYTIPNNLEKHFCSVCECALAGMLPAHISHFKPSEIVNVDRPNFCWMKKETLDTFK